MKCKNCGDKVGKGYGKNFCSFSCYNKFNYKNNPIFREKKKKINKETYEKIKDNPDYKTRKRRNFLLWLDRNRDKYNQYQRERYHNEKENKN